LIIAVYGCAFWAFGPRWWVLVAALGGRAFIVSVADNAYHYGTELDAPLEAMNLRLPRPLKLLVLAFNLHGVHHKYPGLAWHSLRAAFENDDARFETGWFAAVGRQINGPISEQKLKVPVPASARRAPGVLGLAGVADRDRVDPAVPADVGARPARWTDV
jgi:hypothetical protein